MGDAFTVFIIVLIALAAFTRETFVVMLLYLFVGAGLLGRLWVNRTMNRLVCTRKYDHKSFPGESIPVRLEIQNGSWLPAVWLRLQDYYPIEVAETPSFAQVVSLGPREKTNLQYTLKAQKRGYYTIGPLHITSGDLLGMSADQESESAADHLTVYPKVIPLTSVKLPSQSPMGTLRHKQPIYEDPTRTMGKRDYYPGDSIRRIDWKSSAATGRLQTKLFEPSIALETMLFLNLNLADYLPRTRFDATELAIVVTASLANWITSNRQSAGLISNGIDPLAVETQPVPLPSRKGRSHLMRMLEVLARIRAAETEPFPAQIRQHRVSFSWGTTLIIVTGSADRDLFDELLHCLRVGLNPVLILCGEHPEHRQSEKQGKLLGIPTHIINTEKDLDQWKK